MIGDTNVTSICRICAFVSKNRPVQTWAVRFLVDLKFDLIGRIFLYGIKKKKNFLKSNNN